MVTGKLRSGGTWKRQINASRRNGHDMKARWRAFRIQAFGRGLTATADLLDRSKSALAPRNCTAPRQRPVDWRLTRGGGRTVESDTRRSFAQAMDGWWAARSFVGDDRRPRGEGASTPSAGPGPGLGPGPGPASGATWLALSGVKGVRCGGDVLPQRVLGPKRGLGDAGRLFARGGWPPSPPFDWPRGRTLPDPAPGPGPEASCP